MALDDPEEIRDLFSAFGPISVRRMFSGAGLFAEGVMFALRIRDDIFLKADAETIPALTAAHRAAAKKSRPTRQKTRKTKR